MPFDPESIVPPGAKIKVIGVGGGGSNAVNTMIKSNLGGVEFVTCNTDVQSLRFSLAPQKLQIGKELTRGLGAGADPDIGRDAALEDRHEIQEFLAGADMVFITAGMGGGTGTGGAAVVAQIARELGALTVAVVTKPFGFEGKRRRKHAEAGIARLRECVDTLITIPNQRLLQIAAPDLAMVDAFKMADDVLVNAVKGISDIINVPGIVNVDFADVKTVMSCMGQALMGIGVAAGDRRALEAARQAICSPLLEDVDIEGATGILINIAAGANVTLMEVNEACSLVQEAAHEDANIIFGAVIDETLGENIRVTVIATGFPVEAAEDGVPEAKLPQPASASFQTRLTSPLVGGTSKAAPRSSVTPSQYAPLTSRKPEGPKNEYKPRPMEAKAEPEPALAATPAPVLSPVEASRPFVAPEAAAQLEQARAAKDESAHLMRLTMEATPPSDAAFDASIDAFDADGDFPSLAGESEVVVEGLAPVIVEAAPEQPVAALEARIEGARIDTDEPAAYAQSVEETIEARLIGAIFDESSAHEAQPVAPQAEEALEPVEAPLDSFFENDAELIAGDIDRKIDEALELAERLKSPEIKRDGDDLDVPAFLRSGLKDFTLG